SMASNASSTSRWTVGALSNSGPAKTNSLAHSDPKFAQLSRSKRSIDAMEPANDARRSGHHSRTLAHARSGELRSTCIKGSEAAVVPSAPRHPSGVRLGTGDQHGKG